MAQKESIEIRHARETRMGDPVGPVKPWETIRGCLVVPRESQDFGQRGRVVLAGFMIKAPRTATILDTDEIRVRGEIYQVDGAVGDFRRKGKLFYVKRVS
jgi:hypothetical protein